jgi:hypothetical protein
MALLCGRRTRVRITRSHRGRSFELANFLAQALDSMHGERHASIILQAATQRFLQAL